MNMFSNLQKNFTNFYILNGKRKKKKPLPEDKEGKRETEEENFAVMRAVFLCWAPVAAGLGWGWPIPLTTTAGTVPAGSPPSALSRLRMQCFILYTPSSQNDRIAGDGRDLEGSLSLILC